MQINADGTHCPMVLFWPITESISNGNYTEHFVPISELSKFSGTQELDPYVMFPNTANCPLNFYRKGELILNGNLINFDGE